METLAEPDGFGQACRGWRRYLCCVAVAFGAAGAAGGPALAEPPPGRPAASSYRLVQLGTDPYTRARINAGGQVAFQAPRNDGSYHVRLFDGRRIHDFGTVGGTSATVVGLNDRGQAAFNVVRNGHPRVVFYDGRRLRDLGTLGGPDATAADLNALGQVAGTSSIAAGGAVHPFRWSAATGMADLGRVGAGGAAVVDLNDRGDIAGYAHFPAGGALHLRGFFWSPRTGYIDIGTIETSSVPEAMNDAGAIAGTAGQDGPSGRAFRWTRAGGMSSMGTLRDEFTRAVGINNAGQVVGQSPFVPGANPHPFLYTPGQGLLDLGVGTAVTGESNKVNEQGIVIGYVIDRFITPGHGFIWTRETGMIEIGAGSPELGTSAADVNKYGQVVGSLGTRAFVWTRSQGFIDLNTVVTGRPRGLVLEDAIAVSENGAILATASGNRGLYLLKPAEGMRNPELR